MARPPRKSAIAAKVSMSECPQRKCNAQLTLSDKPIANLTDNEDEDMQDAPQDVATPREDSQDIKDEVEDEEGDRDNDDEDGTPERDSVSRSGTPRRSGRGTSLIPRKRRLGRPPKNKLHSDDEDQKSGSDVATPVKRGRGGFRGHRGGRWGKPRGGPSHV